MSKYIDLVFCKRRKGEKGFLAQAPAWSLDLKEDDEVLVDTSKNPERAIVEAHITMEIESDKYYFLLLATGATLPLPRILGKYNFNKLTYENEEN